MPRATTMAELAWTIGVPPEPLEATIDQFNSCAKAGCDTLFGSGESAYDQGNGDPSRNGAFACPGALEPAVLCRPAPNRDTRYLRRTTGQCLGTGVERGGPPHQRIVRGRQCDRRPDGDGLWRSGRDDWASSRSGLPGRPSSRVANVASASASRPCGCRPGTAVDGHRQAGLVDRAEKGLSAGSAGGRP
jgi:hypothetical protein